MSTNKHAQKDNRDTSNRPALVPSGGRTQTVRGNIPPAPAQFGHSSRSLAPRPPFPFHNLRLAETLPFEEGDFYMLIHRATKPLSEDVLFSLYLCKEPTGMRWAVRGRQSQMAADHSLMDDREILDLRESASFKLCFAVVLKQDVNCQTRAAPTFTTATEKTRPVSNWDAIERVITQEDKKLGSFSLPSSLDYVRVTIKRLENAGFLKFRDETQFWEEILRVEEIFARGDVGPLPDRILLSRHLLY